MPPYPDLDDPTTQLILKAWHAKHSLVEHQIASCDHFYMNTLPAIVLENSTLVATQGEYRWEFTIGNVIIQRPHTKEATGFICRTLPSEARIRGGTYSSSVFIDIEQRKLRVIKNAEGGESYVLHEKKLYREVLLCRIPVMIGSILCHLRHTGEVARGEECVFDHGGYFIVNGMEKVVISQEKLRTNFPYVFPGTKKLSKTVGNNVLICEVRSCHESKMRSTSTLNMHILAPVDGAPHRIVCMLPYIEYAVPIEWLLLMLDWDPVDEASARDSFINLVLRGEDNDRKDVVALVHTMAENLAKTAMKTSRSEVMKIIAEKGTHEVTNEKQLRYMEYVMKHETLPHMGLDSSPETTNGKRIYLGFMIRKLIGVLLGVESYDDRDHYANKRVDTAGSLMSLQFRQLYRAWLKCLQLQIQKSMDAGKFVDLLESRFVNSKRITAGFKSAFGTGIWGSSRNVASKNLVGITQALNQMTGICALSHVRRLNTPLNKETRNPRPRQLPNSAWGIVCPTETPEGGSCGLVKNLAWSTRVRIATPGSCILDVLLGARSDGCNGYKLIVPLTSAENESTRKCKGAIVVLLNGVIVGHCKDRLGAHSLLEQLHTMRRGMTIPIDTSLAYVSDSWASSVCIHTDAGCLLRPIINLKFIHHIPDIVRAYSTSDPFLSQCWDAMILSGAIEYVDKDEEATLRVAETMQDVREKAKARKPEQQPYTHVEIHPSIINGVCASLIPFSNHNQSPRNTYQSAMGKQAIGIPVTNFQHRLDAAMHVLDAPQKAFVNTWMDEMVEAQPSGQNVMVAIMCHSGFNQEDSLIMNQSSVDNGMFRSIVYRTYKEETRAKSTDSECFEPPTADCSGRKTGSYAQLDPDTGIAKVGSKLTAGDIIIGKTITTLDPIPTSQGGGKTKSVRDKSIHIKPTEEGVVDMVVTTCNQEGQKTVKVRTHAVRIPEMGDKFSSRHGQKGVVGMMLPRQDMPFSEDGIVPDLIVNPHAIPSRMTIGQLLETLLGEECCSEGKLGDGTPFRDVTVEQVAGKLVSRGFDPYGRRKLRCGLTGQALEASIFIGPAYYQRLKHMVNDKIHARSRGPIALMTRQPVEGRSKDGGLRIGEMERDCFASHGAAYNLKECLFEKSDAHQTHMCKKCGLLGDAPPQSGTLETGWCHACATGKHIAPLSIPFAFQLAIQEMQGLHISTRLRPQKEKEKVPSSDEGGDQKEEEEKKNSNGIATPSKGVTFQF